jgi:hypothetical protein
MFLVGIISYSRARFPFPETHFPGYGVVSLPFFFQDFGFFGSFEAEQYPPGSSPGLFFFRSFPFKMFIQFSQLTGFPPNAAGAQSGAHCLFFTACFFS